MIRFTSLLTALFFALVMACGGAQQPAESKATPSTVETPEDTTPPEPGGDDLDADEATADEDDVAPPSDAEEVDETESTEDDYEVEEEEEVDEDEED